MVALVTSFHDPTRPKLFDLHPCWLTAPKRQLPTVNIWPCARDESPTDKELWWDVRVDIDGEWAEVSLTTLAVAKLLREWNDDPEGTLEKRFGRKPPIGRSLDLRGPFREKEIITTSVASPEDLDL